MPLKRLPWLALAIMLGLGFVGMSFGLLSMTSPALARKNDPLPPVEALPAIPRAQGSIITVGAFTDDNTPNGNCTLREAVIAANTNAPVDACPSGVPGEDTIILPAGVYDLTIPPQSVDDATSGDLDITESLIVRGAAAETTSVDGPAHGDRIFHVLTGSLTLQDMAVISGSVIQDNGGGILHQSGAPLRLQNVHVLGNTADSGGGVAVTSGTLIITNTLIISNAALIQGGGVLLSGAAATAYTQTGSSSVAFNSAASGGGIYGQNSTLNLLGGDVFSNSATLNGGGVSVSSGVINLAGGNVLSNSATFDGGGVALFGSSGDLTGGVIGYNRADYGAGVLVNSSDFTISAGSVVSNSALTAGGGLSLAEGIATMTGGEITRNSGPLGGGVNNGGSFTLTGGQIASNTATSGGGISVNGGEFFQTGGIIGGNHAEISGGGLASLDSWQVDLSGGQIISNSAGVDGGGLYVLNTFSSLGVTLSGTEIFSNAALTGSGGGLYVAAGDVLLSGVDISFNRASAAAGIAVTGTAALTQTGSVTITGNVAAQTAGGIGVASNGRASLNGARILGNRAGSDGGAFRQTGGVLVINSSCVVNNSAIAGSYVGGVAPLDATGNWWGAFDGPGGAGPGSGDGVSANVDFAGFLTSPPAGCPFLTSPALEVFESGEETRVAEGGAADDYTLQLTSPPGAPVSVAITTDGQTTVLPNLVTFTAANWATPQQVQLFAVDDAAPEYFHAGRITNTTSSSDRAYAGLVVTLTAVITDNDPAAELEVVKTAPAAALQGSRFTYAITVTNHGPWPATGLVITDILPLSSAAGAQLPGQPPGNDLATAATACLPIGNIFRCNVDSLPPGGKMLLNLDFIPETDGLLINRVEARANEPDPGLYPNSDDAATAVGAIDVDLALTKRASADMVQAGSPVIFSLALTNTGTDAAYGVSVIDSLPVDFLVSAANSTQGSCESGDGAVTCGIGTMQPNAPVFVTITAVPGATYNAPTLAINSAAAAVAVGVDANLANNTASAAVMVMTPRVDLSLSKVASTGSITVGRGLVYTLTVANALTADPASSVMLTDTLPAAVTLGPVAAGGGSCSVAGQVVVCALGQLAPGATRQVSLLVTPTVVATFTNVAEVADAFGAEINPADNSAAVTVTSLGQSLVVLPGAAATFEITNAGGQVIRVVAPAGAVTQPVRLQLDPINLPAAPPGGFGFAGISFSLSAFTYPGNEPLSGFVFSQPISLTLQYQDADLANIVDENALVLYYLSGGNWADAAATCNPALAPQRNLAANQITVAVCHLTEFALMGEAQTTPTYLPVIFKGSP